MDWNEVPDAIGGEAEIIVWHDIMDEKNGHISSDVPDNVPDMLPPNIMIPTKTVSAGNETFEIIEFTQKVGL